MTDETKKLPDWETIEGDFRAGIKTLRQIANEQGVTHVAINKRARKYGWDRDIAAKVRAKAEALVTKKAVTKEVTKEVTKNNLVTEREIVDANASVQAEIILAEREDTRRARATTMRLFDEFEALGEAATDDPVKSLDARSRIVQKLTDALKTQIDLERRVFRIEDKAESTDALKSLLDKITTGNSSALLVVEESGF
jgi:hypothetical protein